MMYTLALELDLILFFALIFFLIFVLHRECAMQGLAHHRKLLTLRQILDYSTTTTFQRNKLLAIVGMYQTAEFEAFDRCVLKFDMACDHYSQEIGPFTRWLNPMEATVKAMDIELHFLRCKDAYTKALGKVKCVTLVNVAPLPSAPAPIPASTSSGPAIFDDDL